jgi:hypothetical protein
MDTIRVVAIIDGEPVDLGVPADRRATLDQASRIAIELGVELGVEVVVLAGEAGRSAPAEMRRTVRNRCAA